MQMNQGLEKLQPYPFEKLALLFSGISPNPDLEAINLSIGEPRHETPAFILEALRENIGLAARYPLTRGSDELRGAICNWLIQRFSLPADTIQAGKHVLPVNGTREALFAIGQCLIEQNSDTIVLTANPFYQIYEGAALLAGASPHYLNCLEERGYIADYRAVPDSVWKRCRLVYLCSPNNPTGSVAGTDILKQLLELSDSHNFAIVADECYSEIYSDEDNPPTGLLQAAAELGREDYRNCLVFHSLSKRSNVPGIRSGFVAGDADLITAFYRYRTYHGCAMAPFIQKASTLAWMDEDHVRENRRLYREKFDRVLDILSPALKVERPAATFYLWPETPCDDTDFARRLYHEKNVTVLPGSYLSREIDGVNPGASRLRIALVAARNECEDAAHRIVDFIGTL